MALVPTYKKALCKERGECVSYMNSVCHQALCKERGECVSLILLAKGRLGVYIYAHTHAQSLLLYELHTNESLHKIVCHVWIACEKPLYIHMDGPYIYV